MAWPVKIEGIAVQSRGPRIKLVVGPGPESLVLS